MTPSAHVRSVQTLQDLKGALNRFVVEAQGSVHSAEGEIRLVEQWLRERQAHWRVEVQRRQEELRLAEADLARCRASASRDSRTGAHNAPSCNAEQAAVQQARSRLEEAQAELSNVENWTRTVGQAAASYRGQAQRLSQKLSSDLPKGHAFLQRKITELQGYLMVASAPSAPSSPITAGSDALSALKPNTWNTLNVSDRAEVLRELENTMAEAQGRPGAQVRVEKMLPQVGGEFRVDTGSIVINQHHLRTGDAREVANTIVHEGRHAYQHYAVEHSGTHPDPGQVAAWKRNFEHYLTADRYGYELYRAQPLESDAWQYAEEVINSLFGGRK